jgi:hypothetical protein
MLTVFWPIGLGVDRSVLPLLGLKTGYLFAVIPPLG